MQSVSLTLLPSN
jgi:hypothetical protein